jgi:outer membrane protein insertion porin family
MRSSVIYKRRVLLLLFLLSLIGLISTLFYTSRKVSAQSNQRVVESVDIQGNRRNRDQDLEYYIQTRPGDVYNERQAQKDLQTLLDLGWFDKTESRVLIQDGARGGVEVIFSVKELPIIRDIKFNGLKSVQESDILKAFRENRIGISKESIYDPVKAKNAVRLIKELLAGRGHPNANININEESVSLTSVALTFDIKEGERVRVVKIDFEGNKIFKDGELRSRMKYVKEAGLITRFKGSDILDRQKLERDLWSVVQYMRSKGYLQANTGEPRIEGIGRARTGLFIPLPLLSSKDDALKVTVPVREGKIYRVGTIKIEGNSIFDERVLKAILGLNPGDVADGERIGKALFEDLKKFYGQQGFLQYTPELDPSFRDNPKNPNEGIADFTINIDEGKQFTLRRLEFSGNTFTRDNVMRREFLLNEGDVYDQIGVENSVVRLNQTGYFDPIDKDKDIERKENEEEGLVDVTVKVHERGRQQISFNGGISGIGGNFFGLEYSTNNLAGRGETLSFNMAAGNRQKSFQFSFTEPYIKDRPITAGLSLFTYSMKFFGQGTFLSGNLGAQLDAFNFNGNNIDERNLFTRKSTGGSLFVSAPLSEFYRKRRFTQFSRVGISYSLSQTSVVDPEVNRQGDAQRFIPVIYRQPNILTSRITPTFVYDTRNYSIDPTRGTEFRVGLGLAGIGGDVRTYNPSLSYSHFIPMRRKKSKTPEVFGFRVLAEHIGNFGITRRIRETASLAFIGGIPVYERFFLGDEFTVRGYDVRSISPIAPIDTTVESRNLKYVTGNDATPLSADAVNAINALGLGSPDDARESNPLRQYTIVGGDTQLLANFEYRIPIFGPVSLAAYADIGTSFNLRKGRAQSYSSDFLDAGTFLTGNGLDSLTERLANIANRGITSETDYRVYTQFGDTTTGAVADSLYLYRTDPTQSYRLLTYGELPEELSDPSNPQSAKVKKIPSGAIPFSLRGEARTTSTLRMDQAKFNKFKDFQVSTGFELRVQVPVVNVPFRLIYFFNPNARGDFKNLGDPEYLYNPEVLGGTGRYYFGEKRSGFRFSIGRTF